MPNYANFVGPAYVGRVHENSYERCLNLYPEHTEDEGGKYAWTLIGTPGTTSVDAWNFGSGNYIRGMHKCSRDGQLYVVAGGGLYQMPISEMSSPLLLATLPSAYTTVQIADDGRYIGVVDGTTLYVLDLATPGANFTTPLSGLVKPNSITFVEGYTLVNNTWNNPAVLFPLTSSCVYFSNVYDMSTWAPVITGQTYDPTALQFFTKEGVADPCIRLQRRMDQLFLFGTRSMEVWQANGDANKPFARIGGTVVDLGIYVSTYACTTVGTDIFWLGTTNHGGLSIYKSNGYMPQRISNHGVEYSIGQTDASDCVAWSYEQEGHRFVVFNFRGGNLTWVYDDAENSWHEAASRIQNTGKLTCWDPIYAASVGTETYVGSNFTTSVIKLDIDKYTEYDGRLIERERSGPVIWDDLKAVRHSRFQLDMDSGNGISSGQGSNPEVMMCYSDDGGYTWSDEENETSGMIGDYGCRIVWNRLGMAFNRIYKIRITDPVKVYLCGASVVTSTAQRH